MKVLLDACVWGGVKDHLVNEGYDVLWVGDWPNDPGDIEILSIANHEDRILVTLDKDFGELAIVRELPHKGIIRLINLAAKQQAFICSQMIHKYSEELSQGAIVTADLNRVRIRPAKS
ncbi:toxin-antitoxin system, toxin component, PIN family protein [bacterium]|nr:toxin-antitoxin system, toxin component, PIN family protein [bacterium]